MSKLAFTLDEVREFIRENGPMAAEDFARQFGAKERSARYTLIWYARNDKCLVCMPPEKGAGRRPLRKWALVEDEEIDEREIFPRQCPHSVVRAALASRSALERAWGGPHV